MLQTIRDKTQGVIATIIVGVITLTFAIWGIHYYLEESKSTTVVVEVNGAKLTQDTFDRLLRRDQRLWSMTQPNTPMSDALQQKIQQATIEEWVQTTLLTEAAKKARFLVSPQILQDTLMNLEIFQQNGQFSPALYQQRIDAMGFTPEEFQKNLQDQLLIDQVRYGLLKSDFILPNELQGIISTVYQTRDIGYVVIPQKSFISNVVVKSQDIQSYYQQHQADFMDPEKIKIDYLQITPQDLKQKVTVSDKDIQAYYQTHTELQSKPLSQVKSGIKEHLQNQGIDKLMASLSDQLDSLSYENPTTLQNASEAVHIPIQTSDWLTQQNSASSNTTFPPAVIQAAFSNDVLQQGYNSSLLTLNDGSVMVLRLRTRVASTAKPLTAVQTQIKAILTAEAAKKASQSKGEAFLKMVQSGSDPKATAQKNGVVWQEAFNISRSSAGLNPELLVAAFNMPLGQNNQALFSGKTLSNGDYLILKVNSVRAGANSAVKDKGKALLTLQWSESLGNIDYALYERGLRNQAKIKIQIPKGTLNDEDGQ